MLQSDEEYQFHQTPKELAKKLIEYVPIQPEDTLCEPFRGEGAFYDAFPAENPKDYAEIREGKSFKAFEESTFDWIISNPPFRLEENNKMVNRFFDILMFCLKRVNIGVAFLMSSTCFESLTPIRLAQIAELGFGVKEIVVCNVKKWRGRYYFVIFLAEHQGFVKHLDGNY